MILEIDGHAWETPLTRQPLTTVGAARLTRKNQRGTFHYEGTGGFEFYRTRSWMPVTALQRRHGRRWKTWMVDDPLHWNGMREIVEALPAGEILVAGLGLGLMLHHISTQPRFSRITVVEASYDVVRLIRPTLPADTRVAIVVDDFYNHIRHARRPDAVLWDLAVGEPQETFKGMLYGRVQVAVCLDAPLYQFGVRRHGPRPEGVSL